MVCDHLHDMAELTLKLSPDPKWIIEYKKKSFMFEQNTDKYLKPQMVLEPAPEASPRTPDQAQSCKDRQGKDLVRG